MMKNRFKSSLSNWLTYAGVIIAFVILQVMASTGGLTRTMEGQLVPVCAYIVMALSLK